MTTEHNRQLPAGTEKESIRARCSIRGSAVNWNGVLSHGSKQPARTPFPAPEGRQPSVVTTARHARLSSSTVGATVSCESVSFQRQQPASWLFPDRIGLWRARAHPLREGNFLFPRVPELPCTRPTTMQQTVILIILAIAMMCIGSSGGSLCYTRKMYALSSGLICFQKLNSRQRCDVNSINFLQMWLLYRKRAIKKCFYAPFMHDYGGFSKKESYKQVTNCVSLTHLKRPNYDWTRSRGPVGRKIRASYK